jgi:hypothetical protein
MLVGGKTQQWAMMHVGEMMPQNKAVGPSERQEGTLGDKTYRETISEKICAR